MASREAARKNNLNDRAHKVGIFDQDLSTQDIDTLIAFYDYTCLKCGTKPANSPDHVIPLSKPGSSNKLSNLQLLCVNCNKAKGDEEIDYRKGVICPDELHQEQATNKRYNWAEIRADYVSSDSTLRELALKYSVSLATIGEHSSAEHWQNDREQLANKIRTGTIDALAQEGISSRVMTAKVAAQAFKRFISDNPRVNLNELVSAFKLLGAYEGEITERTAQQVTDASDLDDSDIITASEHIAARAKRKAADSDYQYSAPDEDGLGAGWSD